MAIPHAPSVGGKIANIVSLFGCLIAFGACVNHRPQGSAAKITNGTLDLGDAGIFLIQSVTPSTGQKHSCTAVLIRPDLLLTAAHCVEERDTKEPRQVQLALPNAPGVKTVKVHPQYQSKARFDVALLRLDRPLLGKQVVLLASKRPEKGDQVRLVGFGDNQIAAVPGDARGGCIKRTGYSTVTALDDHYIYSRGIQTAKPQNSSRPNGVDSAAAHGDSGGPLLNRDGQLLGIAKAINTSSEAAELTPERPIVSAYTQVDVIRDFIESGSP